MKRQPANVSAELAEMAYELADSCARSDIETHCVVSMICWYDTGAVALLDIEFVQRALRYLDARGLVNHHPDTPRLVNFEGFE